MKIVICLSLLCLLLPFQTNASSSLESEISTTNVKPEQGISMLGRLIIKRDTAQAVNLIKKGVDLREYQSETSIRKIVTPSVTTHYVGDINLHAFPLIILAAVSGQDAIIKTIKEQDEDAVYLQDFQDNDALMWAAREGHPATVSLLLSYGFDPLYQPPNSHTSAFEQALEKRQYQVLDVLVTHLIQTKQTDRLPELIWHLSGSDQTKLLEKYLRMGIKDTFKAIKPRTSLMKAADGGKLEHFKLLIQFGSDPYESNIGSYDYNYDALTYAIPHDDFLLYLLNNYDYDLSKTFEGQNYLHVAVNRYNWLGQKAFLLLLKKSGLNINSEDSRGNTLLDKATIEANTEYVNFFLSLDMSTQNVKKALQNARKSLRIAETNYHRVHTKRNLETIETLTEICQILLDKISQNDD